MSYQISVDGRASADLQQVLHALERQLYWHGIHAETPADMAASEGASAVKLCDGKPCPTTIIGHGPNFIIGLGLGLLLGFVLCRILKKS
jgi:hypothetical protein